MILDPRKENFIIYFFTTYIRNFSFRGSQIENVDFFSQLPNESKIAKINFTNKKFVKMARKKNFLIYSFTTYIRNFQFRASQIENADFFRNPQTSHNLQKSTLLIKISSKWPEKKIFLYIPLPLI